MSIKIAINGFGRIGRLAARAILEGYKGDEIELVAINDLTDIKTNAHLLKYDSVHQKFSLDVNVKGDDMEIGGKLIRGFAQKDPSKLPWKDLGIDVVYECTGAFKTKEKAKAHLDAGAKKVIISAPGGKDIDATVVFGVNEKVLKATDTVISNASCTTNCLAPLVKPLHEKIGLVNGLMTTIHASTNDQRIVDSAHSDLRRARAASRSMIPTKTGAAAAVGLVLPELKGKLNGFAIRVPTINVSVVDLTFLAANFRKHIYCFRTYIQNHFVIGYIAYFLYTGIEHSLATTTSIGKGISAPFSLARLIRRSASGIKSSS